MSSQPLVLVPPSAGKARGGGPATAAGTFDPSLRAPRRAVLRALRTILDTARPAVLEKLLDTRGELLADALRSTRALVGRRAPLLPTWQRYTGVVWTHLDPAALTPGQRARIVVPSAVYGITAGTDPIGDYRLGFGARLGDLGPLARFWQPHVTAALTAHSRGRTIVDLLPGEHAAAVDWVELAAHTTVVHVAFRAAGGARAAGHDAKAVKGAFARAVLTKGLAAAPAFAWRGWRATATGGGFVVVAPGTPGAVENH